MFKLAATREPSGRIERPFLTGGAGFVGSHPRKALSPAGDLLVAFDNLERGHDWADRHQALFTAIVRERHLLPTQPRRYVRCRRAQ
jgi:nucleoside-diphosphate-sugar epimerase